nr:MAG TPA: hypothetical protein [Caudoviricetes sp.]
MAGLYHVVILLGHFNFFCDGLLCLMCRHTQFF